MVDEAAPFCLPGCRSIPERRIRAGESRAADAFRRLARFLLFPWAMMESPPPLPPFDAGDFARRWERCRKAALRSASPPGTDEAIAEDDLVEACFGDAHRGTDPAGAAGADGSRGEALLRAAFDNSRKLGASLAGRLGVTFEIQDLQALLEAAAPPCLTGRWSSRERARVLERPGCDFAPAAGSRACDYWREALDGLVTGLGDRERLARHACVRHGGDRCIDVIFEEHAGAGASPAWAPLPDHMAIDLEEAAEYFRRKTGIGVELKGVNEGVLHFRFAGSTDGRCAPGAASVRLFGELVQARFPGLLLLDATPQAVLSESRGRP